MWGKHVLSMGWNCCNCHHYDQFWNLYTKFEPNFPVQGVVNLSNCLGCMIDKLTNTSTSLLDLSVILTCCLQNQNRCHYQNKNKRMLIWGHTHTSKESGLVLRIAFNHHYPSASTCSRVDCYTATRHASSSLWKKKKRKEEEIP